MMQQLPRTLREKGGKKQRKGESKKKIKDKSKEKTEQGSTS
jgi:hypothetical protein